MSVDASRDTEDLLMQGASDLLMDTLGPAFVSEARSLLDNLVIPRSKQRGAVIIYSISSCIPQDVKLDEDGFRLSLECTPDAGQLVAEQKPKKQVINPRISFGDTVVLRKKKKPLPRQGPLWHLHRGNSGSIPTGSALDADGRDAPTANGVAGTLREEAGAGKILRKLSEEISADRAGGSMPSDRRVRSQKELARTPTCPSAEEKGVTQATVSADKGKDDVANPHNGDPTATVGGDREEDEERWKSRGPNETLRLTTFPPAHLPTTMPAVEDEERGKRRGTKEMARSATFPPAHLPTAMPAEEDGEESGKRRGTKETLRLTTFPSARLPAMMPAEEEERGKSGEAKEILRSMTFSDEHLDGDTIAPRISVKSSASSISSFRSYNDVTGRAVYTSVGLKAQPDLYPPPTPSVPSVPPAMVTTRADMFRTSQKKNRKYKDERRFVDFIPPTIDKDDDDDEEDRIFLEPADPVPSTAVPVRTVRRQQRAVAAAAAVATAANLTETREFPFVDLFSPSPRSRRPYIVTELRESNYDASDLWENSTHQKRTVLGAPTFDIPFYDRVLVERAYPPSSSSFGWATSDSDAPLDQIMEYSAASRNGGRRDLSNGREVDLDSNPRCLSPNDRRGPARRHRLNGKKVRFDTTVPFVPMLGPMCKKIHVIRLKLGMEWKLHCARWKYHANEILTNPFPIINGRGGPLVVECSATLMTKIIVFPGNDQYSSIVEIEPSIEDLAINIPSLSLMHAGFQNWYLKPIISDKITLQLDTGVSNRFKRGGLVYHAGLCVDHMCTVISTVSPRLPELRAHPQVSEWINALLRLSTEHHRLLDASGAKLSDAGPSTLDGILNRQSKVKATDVRDAETELHIAKASDISTPT